MDNYYDYEQEAAYEEMYAEHADQALREFKTERQRSYYLKNPLLAQLSVEMLAEARALLPSSPRACLVLATSAAEVGLKEVLLRPIVAGLVHSESSEGLVADMVLAGQGLERMRNILFELLRKYGGVDMATFARADTKTRLWQEIQENQRIRNGVVHRALKCSAEDAQRAVDVASAVLDVVFPQVVSQLGYHLHDGFKVCDQFHVDPAVNARIQQLIAQRASKG